MQKQTWQDLRELTREPRVDKIWLQTHWLNRLWWTLSHGKSWGDGRSARNTPNKRMHHEWLSYGSGVYWTNSVLKICTDQCCCALLQSYFVCILHLWWCKRERNSGTHVAYRVDCLSVSHMKRGREKRMKCTLTRPWQCNPIATIHGSEFASTMRHFNTHINDLAEA